jgi:hypothetical protein
MTIPALVRWGLLGNVILFVCVAGFNAVVLPWIGAADSRYHMNYMTAVFNGELPVSRSIVAAHPPLYYFFLSRLVGPFLVTDHFTMAVAITRVVNIGFGVLLICVLAWIGWMLGGKKRVALAIALPGLSVLVTPFVRVAGDTYNDTLATLFATTTIAITIALLKSGPTWQLTVALGVVSVLGMSTRSTFAAPLGLALIALVLAHLMHGDGTRTRRLARGIGSAAAVAVSVALAIGWFYLLNQERSGSWFRSRPKVPFAGRDYKSLTDNLLDPDFYLVTMARLLGFRDWNGWFPYNGTVSLALSAIAITGLIVWLARGGTFTRIVSTTRNKVIVGYFVVLTAGLYAMQIQHATGWGNINLRYFLPGLVIIGLVLAFGTLAWPKLRGQLSVAFMSVLAIGAMCDVVWFVAPKYKQVSTENPLGFLATAVQNNGVPLVILPLLWIGLLAGLAIVSVSLFKATAEQDHSPALGEKNA